MGAMEGPALRFSQVDADKKKFTGFLDVPFSKWSTAKTFGDLERELASLTDRHVAYIAYRGVRLPKPRLLSTLIPDLLGGTCSRFSVHTTSGENVFFVKSLGGHSVMVDLPLATSTVKDLKDEVLALERIPIQYQRFQYNGKHFADCPPITKTLRDYGVERDSTVQLLSRLRGGAPASRMLEFSDLQNESALMVLPWSKTAPVWRIAGKGLNLEGKCTNPNCAAHGQRVICKKGFTVVNLVTDPASCPVCRQIVQVKTCSFTSCSWMYEGRKAASPKPRRRHFPCPRFLTTCFGSSNATHNNNNDEDDYPAMEKQSNISSRDIVSPWCQASNKYEYFRQTQNMVQWENLLVLAKKIPTVAKNGSPDKISPEDSCSICFHKFEDAKTHTTTCGHHFHADCVESWLACSGTACPICRVELVVEQ